ncbi:hypothetical protein PIB30_069850 [Stylosanthes scabra]|uniref:Uncharacterized protein n=1 Tax=Stylosanthes scabra TaxID=79078 RepID=A0ABU6SNE6_9FABA|nr:hypothetical protein [Stylosanthes scabra]
MFKRSRAPDQQIAPDQQMQFATNTNSSLECFQRMFLKLKCLHFSPTQLLNAFFKYETKEQSLATLEAINGKHKIEENSNSTFSATMPATLSGHRFITNKYSSAKKQQEAIMNGRMTSPYPPCWF